MIRVFLVISFFFAASFSGWVRTYGGSGSDIFTDVIETEDGGFLLAGYTNSTGAGGYDCWAVRIDGEGNTIWEQTFGGEYNDQANGIVGTGDGYILVGSTNSFGEGTPGYSNIYIVKIDDEGSVIWESTYEGDLDDGAYDVIIAGDSCIVAGYTWLSFSTRDEGILLYINPATGEIEGTQTTTGSSNDAFYSIAQTAYDCIAVGLTKSFGVGTPSYSNVLVVPSHGFEVSIGGDGDEKGRGVVCVDGTDCVIVGSTNSIGAGASDMYFIRVSSSGDIIWESTAGGSGNDFGEDIVSTGSAVVATGYTISYGAGYDDVYIVKVDLDGSLVWERTYGGTGNDHGNAIAKVESDPDGGFIVAGGTMSFGAGDWDGYIIRTNADGDTAADAVPHNEKPKYGEVMVSPNPFNTSCKISLPYTVGEREVVEIYSLSGKVVDRLFVEPKQKCIVWVPEELPAGLYVAKFQSKSVKLMFTR